MPRVRVAVAVTLSKPQSERVDALRRALGSMAVDRIVPHITLVPPHERDPAELAALLARVAEVASTASLEGIELHGVGVFRNRRAVAYLGVQDPSSKLATLAGALGWPASRAFVPHVTLVEGASATWLEGLVERAAGFVEPLEASALSVLLARRRDPRRTWRPVMAVRLGESWMVGRSHLRVRIAMSDGAWRVGLTRRPQRSAFAFLDDEVIGVVSAERRSDAAWLLDDARIFDPGLRGWGVGGALVEALARSLAPALLVAPEGTSLLASRGALRLGSIVARGVGLGQETSWIALSLLS